VSKIFDPPRGAANDIVSAAEMDSATKMMPLGIYLCKYR